MENLAKALVAFQKELPKVGKDKSATVPTKSGGSYKYTYADLGSLTHIIVPLLVKHGLSFVTRPRITEGGYELVGVLTHTSGEFIEGALPIYGRQPQEIGSTITYNRRYLLGCMTGVVTEDDDDANRAVSSEPTTSKDWDAVADTAESLTDPDAVRDLWRREGVGTSTPQVIKERITAHLEALVKEQGETP